MLLQEIVREFDAELMRLASLRAIVANLATPGVQTLDSEITNVLTHPPATSAEAEPMLDSDDAPDDSSAPITQARRGYNRRSLPGAVVRRAARRRPVETGAIASTIPAGPVVVSVAALAQERTHRGPTADTAAAENAPVSFVPQLTTESSNDLARTLAQRWLSGENASL